MAEGELTLKQVHELTIEIKQRRIRAIAKHMKEVNFPDRPRLIKQAQSIADQYFKHYYDEEPNFFGGEDDR